MKAGWCYPALAKTLTCVCTYSCCVCMLCMCLGTVCTVLLVLCVCVHGMVCGEWCCCFEWGRGGLKTLGSSFWHRLVG